MPAVPEPRFSLGQEIKRVSVKVPGLSQVLLHQLQWSRFAVLPVHKGQLPRPACEPGQAMAWFAIRGREELLLQLFIDDKQSERQLATDLWQWVFVEIKRTCSTECSPRSPGYQIVVSLLQRAAHPQRS